MPPALIAGAVGLAGSVGGALISSNASKNAAKQVAAGNAQAIAEQRRQFDLAQQLLSPYVQGGNQGLQGLLALSGAGGYSGTAGTAGTQDWNAYLTQNPDVAAEAQRVMASGQFGSPQEYAQFHYSTYGQNEGRQVPMMGGTAGTSGMSAQDAQGQAIAQLENSPMFQGLVRQGEQGILQNASPTGGLRGGNVQGALAQFRPAMLNQQIQQQLANFQGIASLGQNAAAGVGNQAVQTGQQIGNLQQNTGQALGAGSIASGNAWGGALGSIGNIAGGLFGGGGMPNVNQIMAGANASLGVGSPGMVRAF